MYWPHVCIDHWSRDGFRPPFSVSVRWSPSLWRWKAKPLILAIWYNKTICEMVIAKYCIRRLSGALSLTTCLSKKHRRHEKWSKIFIGRTLNWRFFFWLFYGPLSMIKNNQKITIGYPIKPMKWLLCKTGSYRVMDLT